MAHPVTQKLLQVHQPSGLQGTRLRATRVDKVDHHHLILDKIVEETDRLAFMGDQRDIGKVVCSPTCAPGSLAGGLLIPSRFIFMPLFPMPEYRRASTE